MISTALTAEPLAPVESNGAGRGDCGSEIIFHGRVRDREESTEIVALFYEHYEGMAENQLQRLAEQTADRFGIRELTCIHRVGEVPVGETSVRVMIRSTHRAEGLEALAWFVRELKIHVPIWKWGVLASGERFPSNHCEGCAGHD